MDLDGARMLAVTLAVGSGVWVGGLVTVIILSASSRKTIAPPDRVVLFRDFGRRFAIFVGVTALFVVLPALVLATIEPAPLTASTLLLALGLLLATAAGILQARRMTRLRGSAAGPVDAAEASIRGNAQLAAAVRVVLVLGYLALVVLAALQASIA
ncbi:hypothetical protein GCM10022239_15440 [Leifsonia bigeumensis]|uniref:DUF4149 domain-containing protein n=1 Tax=Leifsonella bigeumensis TaxID=433643 RepID=A0ABP7FIK7_9MICO